MKTLIVVRHAKSSWADASLNDHERPLNARGRRDAPRVGQLLRALPLTPDVVITSDAVRARATAEALVAAAGIAGPVLADPRLYLADPDDIIHVLRTVPATARTVLIIGHNPGLEELVERFTGEAHALPTAALVRLVLDIERWSDVGAATRGRLLQLWRPKDESG